MIQTSNNFVKKDYHPPVQFGPRNVPEVKLQNDQKKRYLQPEPQGLDADIADVIVKTVIAGFFLSLGCAAIWLVSKYLRCRKKAKLRELQKLQTQNP